PARPGSSREGKALVGPSSKSGRIPYASARREKAWHLAVPTRPFLQRPLRGGARVPELQTPPRGVRSSGNVTTRRTPAAGKRCTSEEDPVDHRRRDRLRRRR